MEDPLVGKKIDGYHILEVIGQGGMGVVYKAKNLSLDRVEALKVIAPLLVQDAQFLRRFEREAQALARIHHANIVTIYTLRNAEIGAYLTMEYVEGDTLADRLAADGAMDWHVALPIIKQLLAGFDYAHRCGIIHRDIKPRNIMLTGDGVVKVMDFGLAKFYQQHDVTRTQGVSGTLSYMSPEQIKGQSDLDQRSDIFSLGMTLYELLSGRLPFDESGSQFSIQRSIVEDDFPSPHRFEERIPPALSAVIMKAVAKEREDRYQRASEMLDALATFEAEISGAEDTQPTIPLHEIPVDRPDVPRRRWRTWAGGAVLLGVLAVGTWAMLSNQSEAPEPAQVVASNEEPDTEADETASLATEDEPSAQPSAELSATPETQPATVEPPPTEPPTSSSTDETPTPQGAAMQDDEQPEAEPSTSTSQETQSVEENTAPSQDTPDEDVTPPVDTEPPPTESPSEPELQPIDRVRAELDGLQARLQQAIMEQEWTELPAPLADHYSNVLDDFYSKFTITTVESAPRELRTEGTTVVLPITVYISYQQKGREGVQAFPIPATWVWEENGGELALRRVREQ